LLAILTQQPQLMVQLRDILPAIDSQTIRGALSEWLQSANSARFDIHAFAALLPARLQQDVVAGVMPTTWAAQHERLANYHEVADPEGALERILQRRRHQRLRAEQSVLQKKLAELGTSGDPSTVRQINARLMEIDKVLKGPKGQP